MTIWEEKKSKRINSEENLDKDYRNGYKTKQVNSSYSSLLLEVPQDRNSTF